MPVSPTLRLQAGLIITRPHIRIAGFSAPIGVGISRASKPKDRLHIPLVIRTFTGMHESSNLYSKLGRTGQAVKPRSLVLIKH